jgi:hypothetical protein
MTSLIKGNKYITFGQRYFYFLQLWESGASAEKQKGNLLQDCLLSNNVGMAGFEPATSWSQTRRDTGLRYIPN